MKFVGIDLAGSEKRETGFCILEKNFAKTKILYKDEEIIREIKKIKPKVKVVAIDAPLSIPIGRKSLEEKSNVHLRECDKELMKMKIKFFPITLGPMRSLTKRGIKLKKEIEKIGIKVIETYPGAFYDIFKIKRRDKEIKKLFKKKIKIKFEEKISRHELDAIACAIVAKMFHEKKFLAIGNKREGLMILPKK